jgi:hypothetical protein
LQYWDGSKLCANPHRRVSDTDGATITTLSKDHGIRFAGADKRHTKHAQDAGAARKIEQPKLYVLRQWMANDMIEVWPNSGPLESQLNAGRWNEQRTDFERTETHGHLDCLMALVYMLPAIERNALPDKPAWADADPQHTFIPEALKKPEKASITQLNAAFGRPRVGGKRRFA